MAPWLARWGVGAIATPVFNAFAQNTALSSAERMQIAAKKKR